MTTPDTDGDALTLALSGAAEALRNANHAALNATLGLDPATVSARVGALVDVLVKLRQTAQHAAAQVEALQPLRLRSDDQADPDVHVSNALDMLRGLPRLIDAAQERADSAHGRLMHLALPYDPNTDPELQDGR